MIEELRQNIQVGQAMVRELIKYEKAYYTFGGNEKKFIGRAINSLRARIKIINNSIPEILDSIGIPKGLGAMDGFANTKLENVSVNTLMPEAGVNTLTLKPEDKKKFLQELQINREILKKLKNKKNIEKKEGVSEFGSANWWIKISNKFFLDRARKLTERGYFEGLGDDLKKTNIGVLFQAYVAMIFFSVLSGFVISVLALSALIFINFELVLSYVWIIVVVPLGIYIVLYYYPSMEKNNLKKNIDNELPFAVIHMSAVSGSGITPSEIFKILALGDEYPYLNREIRKVLNSINVYGYDLSSALISAAKSTPSAKLEELFNGIATTINSGGDLQDFFEKRADSLLVSYRIDKEKFTKTAETFMDIYISVVIATPMILLLLLIIMNASGISVGLSPMALSIIIVLAVAIVNIIFLGILHLKQLTY